jgi:hypothetical protein
MQSVIYIDNEGNLSGLADDTIDKLNMGKKQVERVSNVEYNHEHQCWVATDLDGKIIAEHPVRSEVIAAERRYLNRLIEDTFISALALE